MQERRSFRERSRVFRRANIGGVVYSCRAINWTSGLQCKKLDKRRQRSPRGGCVPHERAETPRRINFACSPSRRQRDRSSPSLRAYRVSRLRRARKVPRGLKRSLSSHASMVTYRQMCGQSSYTATNYKFEQLARPNDNVRCGRKGRPGTSCPSIPSTVRRYMRTKEVS